MIGRRSYQFYLLILPDQLVGRKDRFTGIQSYYFPVPAIQVLDPATTSATNINNDTLLIPHFRGNNIKIHIPGILQIVFIEPVEGIPFYSKGGNGLMVDIHRGYIVGTDNTVSGLDIGTVCHIKELVLIP